MKNRLLVCCALLSSALMVGSRVGAQQELALPRVSSAEVPLYPPLARTANISGVVHLVVTTDGHKVVATSVRDGKKILGEAAEKNAQTWQFGTHEPTSFTVTYIYKLVVDIKPKRNNPRVLLQLPTEIEVDELRWPRNRDASPSH